MFVCQVIASRGNGGLEKHVRDLSASLVEQGHRVFVIGDPVFVKTLAAGVTYCGINMRMSRYNPWLIFQVYQCLRRHQFDVIHAQANKAASLLFCLKWLFKTPVVVTVHNIKSQFSLFRRFKHVICVSRYLAKQVNTTGAEVIYNGIDAPSIKPIDLKASYHLPLNKPVICTVGRLVPAKGFDVLLEAVDGLDLSLLIVGEGPQRFVLENKIASMQSNTHVCLIGHHDNPSALMRAASGVVISSRREGFSYVFNEAVMCGARVISTDVPVANEVLPKALVVAVDNADALRKRLKVLLRTPNYWTSLMQGPQQFVQQEMTIKQMTKKTVDLYRRMCQSI